MAETADTSAPKEVVADAEIIGAHEVFARLWKFRGAVSVRGNEQEKDNRVKDFRVLLVLVKGTDEADKEDTAIIVEAWSSAHMLTAETRCEGETILWLADVFCLNVASDFN